MLMFLMLQIAEADSVAGVGTGWVLDNFPKTLSQIKVFQEDQILPDMLFCLTDSKENDGKEHRNNSWRAIWAVCRSPCLSCVTCVFLMCWAVLKRMYEKNKETIDEEIRNRLKAEIAAKIQQSSWVQVQLYCKVLVGLVASLEWLANASFLCLFQISEEAKVRCTSKWSGDGCWRGWRCDQFACVYLSDFTRNLCNLLIVSVI